MARLLIGIGILLLAETAMAQMSGQQTQAEQAQPGGAFNLRILSDSVPDFSTRENFAFSALSHLNNDHDKAITQWRWMHRSRRVGPCVIEDGRPVLDPVLFFNSYGVTFCSMIAQMNCSIWEARGLPSRLIDLPGHVVSECFYDDAWHVFDNDFCNYFLNEKGAVASAAELANSRIHGNIADRKPDEFYIFDHCPAASCINGRIFMGPSSASLIEVARDWYPSPAKVRVRKGYTGSHAGHRYILGLLPGQSYTRYWQPMGIGEKFARLFPNGKDPSEEGGQVLRNSRANGKWTWNVDLSDPASYFEGGPGGGAAVFRVMAANVVTSASFVARGADVKFSVSTDAGRTWQPIKNGPGPAYKGARAEAAKEIAGRLEYLLKVDGPTRDMKALVIITVTQVNPRTLPALRLGTNNIVAISDGHYETVTFNPRLTGEQAAGEVFKVEGFQGIKRVTDSQPSILSTGGDAKLVLRTTTPRPITGVRMASTLHQAEPSGEFFMHSSFDGGKTWSEIRHDLFAGWPADHRREARQELKKNPPESAIPGLAGARDAQLKYSFDAAGCGLVNVFAEVNYEPSGPFMPYYVSYRWSEYRDGKWLSRAHKELIDSPYHKYQINVGGTRPPRMEYVQLIAGERVRENAPDLRVGYTHKEDVGDRFARPGYRIVRGNNVARGCKYEASRPASDAFPDVGEKILTDGMFQVSSFWGLADINLTGKKNERRVGDLAVWAPGEELVVTVDLGKSQTIAGARICAVQPNENIHYPSKMTVETSADGKTFAPAGETTWEECFFPPADEPQWEGTDSPIYEKLPAGGILDFKFPIVFKHPAEARYVRFRLAPPVDAKAGMALWELEVYDKLVREPFEDKITLPAKE